MRIGILTFHRAYNCGAMLQAWALKTVLERMGHSVAFPDCNRIGDAKRWTPVAWTLNPIKFVNRVIRWGLYNLLSVGTEDLARYRYRKFRAKYLPLYKCSVEDFEAQYDVIVEGSDQVWTQWIVEDCAELFLGESIKPGIPLVAYAISAGDVCMSKEWKMRILRALPRYDAISVREAAVREQLSDMVNVDMDIVCDPTLLLQARDYDTIAILPKTHNHYLYVYAIHATEALLCMARKLSEMMGLELIVTPIGQFSRWRAPAGLTYSVSPERMIGYIKNAECVLTNSFHGTAISLLYQKPLISFVENDDLQNSRQASILRRIGEEGRIVGKDTAVDGRLVEMLRNPIERPAIVALESFRAESLNWLKKSIGTNGCNTKIR